MSRDEGKQIEAIFNHHLQALVARDVDAIMEDYTDESMAITNSVPEAMRGRAAIRALFTHALEVFSAEALAGLQVHQKVIAGEVAYIVWSMGEAIPFASDTFVIRGGKIAIQTAALQGP